MKTNQDAGTSCKDLGASSYPAGNINSLDGDGFTVGNGQGNVLNTLNRGYVFVAFE